ncbi:MAG: hypothetical protein ICCCNLDF_02463 [Planctomycetes bacterium]|nr:hypothetical protein [Planctomycetota bacterium]
MLRLCLILFAFTLSSYLFASANPTLARLKAMPLDTRSIEGQDFTDAELEVLPRFEQLESLTCWDWQISAKGWAALAKLPNLKTLELQHGAAVGVENFDHLAKLSGLEVLKLASWETANDESLSELAKLTGLRELVIRSFQGSGAGLKHLARLPLLQSITFIGAHELQDDQIAQLVSFPALTRVALVECCDLTDATLEHLAKLPKLEELSLDAWDHVPSCFTSVNWNNWTTSGLKHIKKLERLRLLVLRGSPELDDETCALLAEFKTLEHLDIGYCMKMTDEGIRHLALLPKLRVLHAYCLNGETIYARGFDAFGNDSPLEELYFTHDVEIDSAAMAAICGLPRLRVLDMSYCCGVEMDALVHLATCTQLQEFRMYYDYVTPEVLRALCKVQSLQVLEIGADKLDDDAISALASLKHLRVLRLFDAEQLTDTTFQTLGRLTSLTELEVDESKVTAKGVRFLAALKLTSLKLNYSGFTPEAVRELAAIETLESLAFTPQGLDESAVRALATLPKLRDLSLWVNEQEASALSALSGAPSLEHVYIGMTTKAACAKLQELEPRLPLISLEFYPGAD